MILFRPLMSVLSSKQCPFIIFVANKYMLSRRCGPFLYSLAFVTICDCFGSLSSLHLCIHCMLIFLIFVEDNGHTFPPQELHIKQTTDSNLGPPISEQSMCPLNTPQRMLVNSHFHLNYMNLIFLISFSFLIICFRFYFLTMFSQCLRVIQATNHLLIKKINQKGNRSLTSKFRECTCLPQKIEENVQINEKQKTSISQLYIL